MPSFERDFVRGGAQSGGFAAAPGKGPGFGELIASDLGKVAGGMAYEAVSGERKAAREAAAALARQRNASAAIDEDKLTARDEYSDAIASAVLSKTSQGEPLSPEEAQAAVQPGTIASLFELGSRAGYSADDVAKGIQANADMYGLSDSARTNVQLALRGLNADSVISREDQVERRTALRTAEQEDLATREAGLTSRNDADNATELTREQMRQDGADSRVRTTYNSDQTVAGPDGETLAQGTIAGALGEVLAGRSDPADPNVRAVITRGGSKPDDSQVDLGELSNLDAEIDAQLGIVADSDDVQIEPSLKADVRVEAERLIGLGTAPADAVRRALRSLAVLSENDGGVFGGSFKEWIPKVQADPGGEKGIPAGNAEDPLGIL